MEYLLLLEPTVATKMKASCWAMPTGREVKNRKKNNLFSFLWPSVSFKHPLLPCEQRRNVVYNPKPHAKYREMSLKLKKQ
jgi:hypothetical protein